MNVRRLGNTDLLLSEVGLGCQSLGGGTFHGGRKEARALVRHALASGITYFDTADHYSLGQSEKLLGEALSSDRDRVVISTKLGTLYTPAAKLLLAARPALRVFRRLLVPMKQRLDYYRSTQRRCDFSIGYLRQALRYSLRRLRTDYVDLLLLHKPPVYSLGCEQIEEIVHALSRSGAVRHVGLSCETVGDAVACLDVSGISALHITINLLEQQAISMLLPEAEVRNIGIIARNPRGAGLLTESFSDVTAETYARDRTTLEQLRSAAKRFELLKNCNRTLAQASIRYVLQLPGVTATTPRANTYNELEEAVQAAALPELNADEIIDIMRIGREIAKTNGKYQYRTLKNELNR